MSSFLSVSCLLVVQVGGGSLQSVCGLLRCGQAAVQRLLTRQGAQPGGPPTPTTPANTAPARVTTASQQAGSRKQFVFYNQLDTILSRSYNIRTSTSMFGVKETVRNDFHLAFIYSFVQTREVFSFSLLILQRFPQTVSLSIYLSIKFF